MCHLQNLEKQEFAIKFILTDIFTPEKRSWVMSRIRGTNTKIDLGLKDILTEMGCEFEMYPKMYGSPDFVMRGRRIIIYCDGDFWHGYKYDEKKKPIKKILAGQD